MSSTAGITGIGLVTALGDSAQHTWKALLAGESIRAHTRLRFEESRKFPRVTQAAIHACREAIGQAGWGRNILENDDLALVVGTSKGTAESWIGPAPPLAPTSDKPQTAGGSSWGLSEVCTAVARELGVGRARQLTLSAACASGLSALIRAVMMISSGEVHRAIVLAAEASVHPLFVGSFHRLGVLPPEGQPCRPFDENRRGFVMSEAAAAVCLERLETGVSPFACIERFAIGGDAHHLTRSDPDARLLRHLLAKVIDGRPIDLFHAHGTGTEFNDPTELSALESVQADLASRDKATIVYSHKAALGHTLGAAGLVSMVINCLCHQHAAVPGNVNTNSPLKAESLSISQTPIFARIHRSLACASGFGGSSAVVSLVGS